MIVFWLRAVVFSLLWIYEIVVNSTFIPLSLLIFAGALGFYFLLSLPHHLLWIYNGLLILLVVQGLFFSMETAMVAFILFYVLIDASFRLNKRELVILLAEATLFFLVLQLPDDVTLQILIFAVFIGFSSYKLNDLIQDRREQQEIYEELLGEYRTLKRLHITAENNARFEERTRISRDIHDSVGHRLTALIMKLEMLRMQEKNPAFDELLVMAKESLEDTRSAVKALQIEESEGIATVVHLIRKLEAESHLLVQFTLKQGVLSVPITNKMSVVLYRVIQEALTNIMRHGDTRDAYITLSKTATDDILFEISNPIRKRKECTMGFGLKNMQERVEEVNGTLRVYQTEDRFVVSGKLTKGET